MGGKSVNFVETRLAKLARNGDRRAFNELVDLYKDKMFHLAYRMLHNVQESEDIVQETFLRVYTNLNRYDETQKFSTWIYRIGTNLCIDRLRKRKATYSLDAEVNDSEGSDWYSMLTSNERTPEGELLLSEMQQQVRKAIDALPEKYKSVVILRYMHDMSLQEISDILDMPVTTVKTRVHRGREFLRERLGKDSLL
ncbi:MAG: sigW [Paenibacillus sp.]|jgi:RNA polymerase sigma-70 factor (ECF subfamily)|nr:sigW [Paenibacillus sp.]